VSRIERENRESESKYDSDATMDSRVVWEAEEGDGTDSGSDSEPESGESLVSSDTERIWMPPPDSNFSYDPESEYDSDSCSISKILLKDMEYESYSDFDPALHLFTPKRPFPDYDDNISYNRKGPGVLCLLILMLNKD